MATRRYDVGAEIEAWCTKCKMDRLHAIETLKSDGTINRVICRTCEGTHLFRRPKSEEAARARTGGTGKRRIKGAVTVSEADAARAKPYAQDGKFEVGDIIRHAKFGPGSVLEVRPGGKMEVGFESGGKLLVCRDTRGSSASETKTRAAAAAAAASAAAAAAARPAGTEATEEIVRGGKTASEA